MLNHRQLLRSNVVPLFALLGLAVAVAVGATAEVAVAAETPASAGEVEVTPVDGEADTGNPETAPADRTTSQHEAVQSDVDAAAAEQTDAHRRKLHEEAVAAVRMTERALELLGDESPRPEAALSELEGAIGKLELVVARNPALATVPVAVQSVTRDVIASLATVRAQAERAEAALEAGRVQEARRVLAGLASEYVVSTTRLPLATYPDAIKAAVPLIDAGKFVEARSQLELALRLQIVEETIYPLPLMRVQAMLAAAEELAENADRKQSENDRLTRLLDAARQELNFGKVLGYYDDSEVAPLHDQLSKIQSLTDGGKSGTGFFTKLKQLVKDLF